MNYNKLRGRIREYYSTESQFANALGVSKCSLSAKLNGKTQFKIDEVKKSCELLSISGQEIDGYFFAKMV